MYLGIWPGSLSIGWCVYHQEQCQDDIKISKTHDQYPCLNKNQ